MNKKYDLIVIGGGILGLFHAYHALQKKLKVAIIEKNSVPNGASVRNFGQVIPSAMNIKWQNYGRESLAIYKKLQGQTDLTVRQNGTVYLASNEEEVQLIEELNKINKDRDYESDLLTKKECLQRFDGLKSDYCKAGLFYPEEITVDSNIMITRFQKLLIEQYGVRFFYNTTIIATSENNNSCEAISSNGQKFIASKIIICGGSEFKTLHPSIYENSDLVATKLQMLQTKPQGIYALPSNILTGLTIRRYEAFEECPSYTTIKSKEVSTSFDKKFGIHILFKQSLDGSIIIGDSHEYADAKDIDVLGYDLNMEIDTFMINEAKKIIDLPTFEIQKRWFGIYSQCKTQDIFEHNPSPNIHIITGIGGKGMTGSAGFSKQKINLIFNKN
ncbi:DadA Glycine/D-amino acid oxidases (deaminating) [Flavobacteriaceae bacterium]